MAAAVADKDDSIIVYCGVGGYANSWWFVLTQVLGYKHVKFYDGSAQEWAKCNDIVLEVNRVITLNKRLEAIEAHSPFA